jgi:hypothetical protein
MTNCLGVWTKVSFGRVLHPQCCGCQRKAPVSEAKQGELPPEFVDDMCPNKVARQPILPISTL